MRDEKLRVDKEWIRARRELLNRVKSAVLSRIGGESEELRIYRERYEKELRRRWRRSTKNELLAQLERADIAYGGDFHAFGQAQRTHLKILRGLSGERPVVLGLECFDRRSQKWLDQYIKGEIRDLSRLRERVRWSENWGFAWESYAPLVDLARKRGFKLLALNSNLRGDLDGDLAERDRCAARLIRDCHLRQPGALIYVVFGDLHLASDHLPQAVRDELGLAMRPREVTIHLNSEKIYFQLARQGLELSVDVVRLSENHYCVMSSPPWLQWQSYLMFLEKTVDQDLHDDHGGSVDYTDQVSDLVRLVQSEIGLTFKLDDLSVYSSEDGRSWQRLTRHLQGSDLRVARYLLASGRSFFLPRGGIGYLARPTVNDAASLAGQYIHARTSRRQRTLWNQPADFPALIWVEAVAFFVSKLVNHKRQSNTLTDLRAQLAFVGSRDQEREALRLALDQSMSELVFLQQGRRRPLRIRPRRKTSYLEAARVLGGMMGERLYLAYRSHKLKKADIARVLKLDVEDRAFRDAYRSLVRLVGHSGPGGGASSSGFFAGIKSKRERL